jgi:hypothetical protein
VDAEQIRREMKTTRASIDRKLDELSIRTTAVKHDAVRRISATAIVVATAGIMLWQWRHSR